MNDSINERDHVLADLPLGVEVRHLAALEAIARTRSFSRAGVLLGYAQSAVSQQIATLERTVGHKLVERPGGPRPVSLTSAGEVLLRHASHITARLGAAKADLDALAAGSAGSLRIGTFQSASVRLLPPTLNRFRQDWPRIDIELRNENSGAVLEQLILAGQLDLAFSDTTGQAALLASQTLIEDPYVLMVATDSEHAGRTGVALIDLGEADLISGSADNSCEARVHQAIARSGAHPRTVFRSDDNLTTQRLVATGLGVAIAPLLAVEMSVLDAAVAVVPIVDDQLRSRRIGLVWHQDRYRSRAAQAFVDTAAAVAAEVVLPTLPTVTSRSPALSG